MSRPATLAIGLTVVIAVAFGDLARPARVFAYHRLSTRLSHVAVIGDSYTTGTDEGGLGPNSWTARAWQTLADQGVRVVPDVAAEGRAGYVMPGDHGSIFEDLTARAGKSDDVLMVFFGSRNDQGADLALLSDQTRETFSLARRLAPDARLLVIGPPWPTPDVPESILQIRDALSAQARAAGAAFVDPVGARWFFDQPELIGPDGVHPTDAGHRYLADKIAPLIRTQLSR
ncbi:MAG: SGNH/GDSL hydrolase family protein [Mycobacterium sp.]|nr:SGNH/GDSL hydrolase family protein [Mycobacterium sp.]